MTGAALSPLIVVMLFASAAILMSLAGLQKKLLRRKESSTPRCSLCGRTDRYNCACRR